MSILFYLPVNVMYAARMQIEKVGKCVLECAFRVHTILGPGLLESVYEAALAKELGLRGYEVERQRPIPVIYEGEVLEEVGFRADLVVNNLVLIELKSVARISDVFKKVVLTYLRLSSLRLGYLINFNEAHLRNGITRVVNGIEGKSYFSAQPESPSRPSPLRET